MRADLGKIYDDTITVINILDASDSLLKQDTPYKTVIEHCMWSDKPQRTVGTNGTVIIGKAYSSLIREWRKHENRKDAFTLQPGDYVVRGVVAEELDAANLRKVLKTYEPDVFPIQLFRDATKGAGFDHSTAGIMRFAEMYYVEG